MGHANNNIFHIEPGCMSAKRFAEILRNAAAIEGDKKIILAPGQYLFSKDEVEGIILPVSNTVIASDCLEKYIAFFMDGISDLTVEGNGAEMLISGDMSAIAMRNCRNIKLENFSIDYLRPRVSEMTVQKIDGNSAEFAIHPDSLWCCDDSGRFCWLDADGNREEWTTNQVVQCAAKGNVSNLRAPFDPIKESVSFEIIDAECVRFTYAEAPAALNIGDVWQFRDPSRRQNGIIIDHCSEVSLEKLNLYFTPGIGVIAQMSENISIKDHRHAPKAEGGRVCSAHADSIQLSSCYGKAEIANCFFSGSQDDHINVHGTYLGITKSEGKSLIVEFRHAETWGWMAFKKGDIVCPVSSTNMHRFSEYTVQKTEMLSSTQIKLDLDREFTESGDLLLENLSACPDITIRDSFFECFPTRGILMSSAGKCRITGNEIRQTAARPAIYISGNVNSWYESGGVRDVEISGNTFVHCQKASVEINPSVPAAPGDAIHRNIKIFGNTFVDCAAEKLVYHSVENLTTDIPESETVQIKFY